MAASHKSFKAIFLIFAVNVGPITSLYISSSHYDKLKAPGHNDTSTDLDLKQALCAPVIHDNFKLFADHILAKFRADVPPILPLPDIKTVVTLYNGNLAGLPTIYRRGTAELSCKDDRLVVFRIELGLKEPRANFHWKTRGFPNMDGTLSLYVTDLGCYLEVEYVFDTSYPSLKKLEIVAIKGADVTITGLGPVTWVLSKMATAAIKMFEEKIALEMEDIVQKLICEELVKMFPKLNTKDSVCQRFT